MAVDPSSSDLRNELARERTVLANERTLLAYVRTSLMLLASGVTLARILRVDAFLRVVGLALVPLALTVAVIGYVRYLRIRRDLRELRSSGSLTGSSRRSPCSR